MAFLSFLLKIQISFIFLCSWSFALDERDFNFDSTSSLGIIPSRGKCPPDTNSETWLFHNETSRCYLADQRGPCNEMMLFYQHPKYPGQGFCDCDDLLREGDRYNLPEYCMWKRPKVFFPPDDRCYSAFHQGPCRKGQWLVLDRFNNPTCELNHCSRNENENPEDVYFWFADKGHCYRTFTYGYCPNKKFIILDDRSWKPICSHKQNEEFSETLPNDPILKIECPKIEPRNPNRVKCRGGRRAHLLGLCQQLGPRRVRY